MMPFGFALLELVLLGGACALMAVWGTFPAALLHGAIVIVCWAVASYYADLYDPRVVLSLGAVSWRLPQAFLLAMLLLAIPVALWNPMRSHLTGMAAGLLAAVPIAFGMRAAGLRILKSASFAERILVVGGSGLGIRLVREIRSRPDLHLEVVGATTPDGTVALDEMLEAVSRTSPHRIVIAVTERRGRLPLEQLMELRSSGILVEDAVEAYERITGHIALESLPPVSALYSTSSPRGLHAACARALSLTLSAAGLLILSPLIVAIGAAILIDSGMPILYAQDRVGLAGRRFRMLKFRTMAPTAHEKSVWVRDNCHRITRLGRWLRKFRLDELPQFVNILRGDMNLVGPRPHPVTNYRLFVERIPHYALRCAVRPGVTGWAQIRYGYANSLEEETEKMRYDLYYIKHLSFWFDLRILLDTVKIVLLGRGFESSSTAGAAPRADEARAGGGKAA